MARKNTAARIEGLENLEAGITRLSRNVQGEHLRQATRAGAEITRSVASQLAPRSLDGSHGRPPGFLAEHIEADVKFTRTQDKAEIHVGMTQDAWYGRLQETGTQFAPAQPFLRPALEATKDDVIDEIVDQLSRRIVAGLGRGS